MSFYDRRNALHLDGSRIFRTAEDDQVERAIAQQCGEVWGCGVFLFGALSPIDWYAVRDERLVGLLEFKDRAHTYDTYPTVFLSVRKWLALTLGAVGMNVPSIFVVRFLDGVRWVPVAEIDATRQRIAGCARPRTRTTPGGIEPVIDVPIEQLRMLVKVEVIHERDQSAWDERGTEGGALEDGDAAADA